MSAVSRATGRVAASRRAAPPDWTTAPALLVFGGSFDPVHRWHTRIAAAARRRLGSGAWILFVPAARSPHKSTGPEASDSDRLAMLRLAIRPLARAEIWTGEMDRGGPSFTIDTVRRLRSMLPPGTRLRLLIGADQAAKFHLWREFREVRTLAPPLVALRPPIGTASALRRALEATGAWSRDEIDQWLASIVLAPVKNISATAARAASGGGSPLTDLVTPAVARYVRARQLYAPPEPSPSPARGRSTVPRGGSSPGPRTGTPRRTTRG